MTPIFLRVGMLAAEGIEAFDDAVLRVQRQARRVAQRVDDLRDLAACIAHGGRGGADKVGSQALIAES